MSKTLPHDSSRLTDPRQKAVDDQSTRRLDPDQVRQIKSKDFDNTPEARALSENFASFDAILMELGITKPSLVRYCHILISQSKGQTRFVCSDTTVGARYFWGDSWKELTEAERAKASKQGGRLHKSLTEITDQLVIRTAKGSGSEIYLPLLNIVLRVSEMTKLGYSVRESVSLFLDQQPAPIIRTRNREHISSKLKRVSTLIKQCDSEDSELTRRTVDQILNPLNKPPVLIHECLKGHTSDYSDMGIRSYRLFLKDDKSGSMEKLDHSDLNQGVAEAKTKGMSLILSHAATNIIQLDDCDGSTVFRLLPYCFEIVETSTNNFHCRLALPHGTREKARASVRDRLVKQLNCNGVRRQLVLPLNDN